MIETYKDRLDHNWHWGEQWILHAVRLVRPGHLLAEHLRRLP